ncbi:IclR family transcriptional regulator (plasmid) [Sphingomonas sp. NY01]|uniref:IclR family transcriptional regulator n=1 Tax=Sphingomonas sp. NY01 TaxID=2968057 RepID=UPI00315D6BBE
MERRPSVRKPWQHQGQTLIQSIERAVALLEIIARHGGAARLGEVAAEAGIGKTTAHNILKTLEALGYVGRRSGDASYHLGGGILNLARIAGDDGNLRRRLRPTLERIAVATGETVYLAVPSGDETYYLDCVESGAVLRTTSQTGMRERLEGSAIGLVFLAFLPGLGRRLLAARAEALGPAIVDEIAAVATRGYALDLEGYMPGLHCIAVPFRERGEVRAALGLSGPAVRLPRARLDEIAWMMMELAIEAA